MNQALLYTHYIRTQFYDFYLDPSLTLARRLGDLSDLPGDLDLLEFSCLLLGSLVELRRLSVFVVELKLDFVALCCRSAERYNIFKLHLVKCQLFL